MTNSPGNRMIQINNGVIGPREPRRKNVKLKKVSDYPELSKAHLEVAEIYADPNIGFFPPPICDESIALIQHMFTEEEASVVRHIKPGTKQTAGSLAAAEHRPIEKVQEILERLANEKHILLSRGRGDDKTYQIVGIPFTSDRVLSQLSMDKISDWHRRYCELESELYETGYFIDRIGKENPAVKYLPMGQVVASKPMAFPSDKLEEVYSRYNAFCLGLCRCRLTQEVMGRGCGKPREVCLGVGPLAEMFIHRNEARRIDMKEALEIKAEAEASGLVTWIVDNDPRFGGTSCSCCGCCCPYMRSISEFNMPGLIAPPHFIPKVDYERCNFCGKCALACPMGAVTVDINNKYVHDLSRCIGCAQCAVACAEKAIDMEAVPDYQEFLQNAVPSL
jgi:electron transport complex protein RnfB